MQFVVRVIKNCVMKKCVRSIYKNERAVYNNTMKRKKKPHLENKSVVLHHEVLHAYAEAISLKERLERIIKMVE